MVAGINLDWLSKIMSQSRRPAGHFVVLVDSTGIVLAAPPDQASMIGRPLDNVPLLSAIADKALELQLRNGLAFLYRRRRLQAHRSVLRAFPERNRA